MLSIIIPCYNRANLIEETLISIIHQSYKNWECIIIDDGSTDNTLDILKFYVLKDSRFRFYTRPKNIKKGASSCRNYGYTLSNGDFICWFDSDDIMPFNSIEDRINAFFLNDCDFVLGKVLKFDHSSNEIIRENSNLLLPVIKNPASEYLLGNFWFQTSAPIFKKSFLEKFSYHFDESLTFNDETEFYVRLLLSNPNFKFVNTDVTLRRMHDESLKVGVCSMPKEEKLFFDQFAYYKIWLAFKKNKKFYDNNINQYFIYYFKHWLIKMKYNKKRLLLIFLQGIRYSMFENNLEMFKVLFWRLLYKK
jgi:glycosyltransferase involved in cell wall biosynthesis